MKAKIEMLIDLLPQGMRDRADRALEIVDMVSKVRDPRVLRALAPAGARGLLLRRGRQGVPTPMPAAHAAHFDWTYPHDQLEMQALYARAKRGQWTSDQLPWDTSVDPLDPTRRLLPEGFLDHAPLRAMGIHLTAAEQLKLDHSTCTWLLSQFLHGEQGALFAAAQVTESIPSFDGKLYGATQVMDEGRHVEVFRRYLEEKMGHLYTINDNLYVIIDSLMTDSRWDMKFLGMQIMVEGLALGSFGMLYRRTQEPLLKNLLKMVIRDEARHVHYGVLALKEHIAKELSQRERDEREDWALEIALLMRNRFLAYEVYEEWFEGRMSRAAWRAYVSNAPGMREFRQVMFSRLMPNLRVIGLLTPRIRLRYEQVGLLQYAQGDAAPELSGDQMLAELDRGV